MKDSAKYGGFAIATGTGGWVIANVMTKPPFYLLLLVGSFAIIAFLWSAYWTYCDLRAWWLGKTESCAAPPPFVTTWRLIKDDPAPIRRLIPLDRAVIRALPKMRKMPALMLTFNLDGQKREKLPGILAQMLVSEDADFDFPLYGIHPPSEELERIPDDVVNSLMFSDDAAFLYDPFEEGFGNGQQAKYICLAIKKRDLKRRLRELGAR